MQHVVKHVSREQELDAALALYKEVFGIKGTHSNSPYSREKWLERMASHGDLMLCSESGGKVIAIVFGRIENDIGITVGPVAVEKRFRKHGIARDLMLLLEKHALAHGINRLSLGAVESAEGFYVKLGYTGFLLIQSEKHSIEELLSLNTKYKVINTNVYDGIINQIYLEQPAPDRELQRKYENTLAGCYTQMVFSKAI